MKLKRVHKVHSRLVTNRSYFVDKKVSVVIMVFLFLCFAFISLTKNCFSSAMVFIVEEGFLTKSQTGTITSVFYVIYGILQIVGGLFADRWHPERLITIGFMGAGIANLVIYFNQSYAVMMSAWIFNALTQFPVWPAIFKIISSMIHPDVRKKAIYLMSFATVSGLMLGYVIAAVVSRWQHNFLFSAIGLMALALIWLVIWKVSITKSEMVLNEHEEPTVPHHDEHPNFKLLPMLLVSGVGFVCIINFTCNVFNIGIKSFVPTMIRESYSTVSSSFATIISLIVLFTGAAGPFIARYWQRITKNEVKIFALSNTIGLIPCGVILLIGKIHYAVIIGAMATLMLTISSANLYYSYVSAFFSRWGKSGTIAGIINFAASFGVFFANFFLTRVADGFGWTATLMVCFGLLLLATVISYIIYPRWEKFKKKEEQ